ncbi:hypothetical protein D3C86_1806140 [compost metagenome]
MRPASASGGREPLVRGHMTLPHSVAFYAEGPAVSFPLMESSGQHAPLGRQVVVVGHCLTYMAW